MRRLAHMGPVTRLVFTVGVGAGVYLVLSTSLDWHVRLLLGWCAGALVFLVQICSMFTALDAAAVKARCEGRAAEGHGPMLVGGILTALASIAAVIYLMDSVGAQSPSYRLHAALSPVAIAFSWLVLQTMFAVYYARLYYQGPDEGLQFPTPAPPDYWDFLYFSCTLAMCYQTSDVSVTSKFIRLVALAQSLICFFYYTVIIGLVMNVIGTVF